MQIDPTGTISVSPIPRESLEPEQARLSIDPGPYPQMYNRTPFGLTHNLHTLDMFHFDSICELADKFSDFPGEHNIGAHAPAPGTPGSVSQKPLKPKEAMERLGDRQLRLLLKRPEDRDDRFRTLLNLLLQQVRALKGGIGSQRIIRLESAVLISSAATTTPLHFDPEIGFFSQIEGEKMYHAYSPSDVSEADLESFYIHGILSICRLDMERRNPENEHVFHLRPGLGFHQPQNSPHWVETCATRSISYTFVIETDATRARGRTRAFNHYQRKLGLNPVQPGTHPWMDTLKAEAMLPDLLVRKAARRLRAKLDS
ncbi:MAG: hypothetical protein ABI164_02285 [Acidobacteriaceae bacterium]